MKVLAPAKLILSGEHAVVYGKPALAMAINRYATVTVTRECLPRVLFDLSNLAYCHYLSFNGLSRLKKRIKSKYHRFIQGELGIRDVLQKPFELIQFTLSLLTETLRISLSNGIKLQVQSDIPIGCGMGSSAAIILSVIHAISMHLRIRLSPEKLIHLALQAENIQHGHSSGLDLRVVLQGGTLYMRDQMIEARQAPAMPLYLVNTGVPLSTTGQCVERVAPYFQSQCLGDAFASITNRMDAALQTNSYLDFQEAIRENHRLLVRLGVVPERVQQFISQIETQAGAAKICGAGTIAGEQAGIVLVVTDNALTLQRLCAHFAYSLLPIVCESRGLRAI
ncbi:MAG: mevalonate kinase [Pseudomonadota bacterium]